MHLVWALHPCKQLDNIGLPCFWLIGFCRHSRIQRLLIMLLLTVRILEDHSSPHCRLKEFSFPLYSSVQIVGKQSRSMFETSNPEVLLLYSYFAPHVRRLVWVLFPSKQDSHSEAFYDPTLYAGSESINSTSASKNSDASEANSRQNQIPLTATASDKQKRDILRKRRKPQGPKIAVNESFQSGRRHRVNLLIVATGEATDSLIQRLAKSFLAIIVAIRLAYSLVNTSVASLTMLLRTLTGHQPGATKSRFSILPVLHASVRVCLSVVIAASGLLLLSLIALLLSASALPALYVIHYFRLEVTVGHVTLRCN